MQWRNQLPPESNYAELMHPLLSQRIILQKQTTQNPLAKSKTTPIKETRKLLRQFILRNKSNYIEHAKEYKEEIIYMKALKALNKNRSENPAYKEIFNSPNLWYSYDLKKKNPKWNRTSVDDLTARTLFTEDNTDEELWFWQQTMLNIK